MVRHAKRKTWRKNKIADVEEALEDERNVEKLKRKAPGKAKGEVFVVDTAGSSAGLSRADRRALARSKIFPQKAPRIGLSACEDAKVGGAFGGGPLKACFCRLYHTSGLTSGDLLGFRRRRRR